MYVADCLYMGSEVSIIAKSELVLKTLISSIGNERGNGDIDVLDIVPSKDVFDIVPDKDVQPVIYGEWIQVEDEEKKFEFQIVCSHCHESNRYPTFNENDEIIQWTYNRTKYCPFCGKELGE